MAKHFRVQFRGREFQALRRLEVAAVEFRRAGTGAGDPHEGPDADPGGRLSLLIPRASLASSQARLSVRAQLAQRDPHSSSCLQYPPDGIRMSYQLQKTLPTAPSAAPD